ncbi:MAG: glucosamine-6-phosphate deaminase [Elusimicrobiota bacterium]
MDLPRVERAALRSSRFDAIYAPEERIPVIVVENFPALGRLTAMRFLEWVQENPDGVVSLPTGKTPEHFIAWVQRCLSTWKTRGTRRILSRNGVDPAKRPDLRGLHFVQIDEFYPIEPSQKNSFLSYVERFYIRGFGMDPGKAMLIDGSRIALRRGERLGDVWPGMAVDLSLRGRKARTRLEARQKSVLAGVDEWCRGYEERIRALGGIGFFLGGIGPDGHIAFNVRGSSHSSLTRLCGTNYETQAAAAGDLGGIEVAKTRAVITLGLQTITSNPDCVAIIMAAGAAKARVVADAVQRAPQPRYPATALHKLPLGRLYVTEGASGLLEARRLAALRRHRAMPRGEAERIAVDISVRLGKPLDRLTRQDFRRDDFGRLLTNGPKTALRARAHLAAALERGCRPLSGTNFLHTEPHHDDLMLGCLPAMAMNFKEPSNQHTFATLTSGFTAVTNSLMRRRLGSLLELLRRKDFRDELGKVSRDDEVKLFLNGRKERGEGLRLARDLRESSGKNLPKEIRKWLRYLSQAYPGQKDVPVMQQLKGRCREWEADCLWGSLGFYSPNIRHLRLGFYTGDLFTQEPTQGRDVPPIARLLKESNPDIVAVAFDPEASGPDTHYKVMQAINAALRGWSKKTRVWGYRNVWFRFHPSEAELIVPVDKGCLDSMERSFLDMYASQREASFPSHEYDGPFCRLARNIQEEQLRMVRSCLGAGFFKKHPEPAIRRAQGLVFMREMTSSEFARHSRALQKAMES